MFVVVVNVHIMVECKNFSLPNCKLLAFKFSMACHVLLLQGRNAMETPDGYLYSEIAGVVLLLIEPFLFP